MNLYRSESSYPKIDAQRNLSGRTHYVDDDTLRFHNSRILSTHTTDDGLLFALIESCAADMYNRTRGTRYVIFDLFGTVVGTGAKINDMWRTHSAAYKAMMRELATLDAKQITLDAIAKAERYHAQEMAVLRSKVEELTKAA